MMGAYLIPGSGGIRSRQIQSCVNDGGISHPWACWAQKLADLVACLAIDWPTRVNDGGISHPWACWDQKPADSDVC